MIFRRERFPNFPRRPADSHRCLLVADNCSPTPGLCRLMEERCGRGVCEMHILVCRQRKEVLAADPALGATGADRITVDDERWDVAEARLDSFMRALGDLGQPLSGEILDRKALRRIRSLLNIDDFDEVVVMAPSRPRRWPSRDLLRKIERSSKIPVIAVPADDLAA